MIFKDQKEEALGGNYKIRDIKIFGSKENLYQNVKKYRKVFDYTECRYLYCELSFYNKLFDEVSWETEIRFVCTRKDSGEEVCELKKKLKISKDKNIIYVREGWGTPDIGWWKEGTYRWEVFIDKTSVGTAVFYVVTGGLVTAAINPYFDIESVHLFESTREGLPIDQRKYLKSFASVSTRYVNIEMHLKNKVSELDLFPIELQFNFYNDSGQQKAYMAYFREIRDHRETILMDAGYGSDIPGYWFADKYTLEVVFMDQLIAVVPFEIGEFEVEEEHPLHFSGQKSHELGQIGGGGKKLSFEDAKEALEELIGLKSVKEQINELASYLQFLKVRKEKGLEDNQRLNLNSVFIGNPGTGKTTVANMLGKIYYSLDLLSHGRVHEVDRSDLVGEFIGQTAPKVKKAIDKARGGILFIDEAYALTNRNDDGKDFGREVVEILLKELSDGEDDLAIIFAGYPKEMSNFLNSNPGLSSRLRNIIHFPDYAPKELMEIIQYTADRRGVLISKEANDIIHQKLVEVYRNRNEQFGNARFVNGVVEEAKQNMAIRLMSAHQDLQELEAEKLSIIEAVDVEKVFRSGGEEDIHLPVDDALLQDALSQLHELVGLDNIKREVDEMSKLVRYYREIGKDVRKSFSVHAVFTGNPGTGKTTVARLLVQIYKALGILERGHLVECDRKGLVAGYVGQTAIKTGEMIDKALGGGLFIDEAYSLTQGGPNDFGREAVETLLKRMEDHRGELMVIVAGYPEEMQTFIEANPGLMSRFDKQFSFNDYDEKELCAIAQLMFKSENLELDKAANDHLEAYVQKLLSNKHKYFGNARTIRKIVSETIRRQHLRMAETAADQRTEELIKQVTLEDISSFQLMEEELEERKGIGFR